MLSIIFTIFKIIGVILLLILLLLALVLLVPIRYQFSLKKEQDRMPEVRIKASWFMFLFTVKIEYINQSLSYMGKILGYQLVGNQPSFLEKKEEKEKKREAKKKEKEGQKPKKQKVRTKNKDKQQKVRTENKDKQQEVRTENKEKQQEIQTGNQLKETQKEELIKKEIQKQKPEEEISKSKSKSSDGKTKGDKKRKEEKNDSSNKKSLEERIGQIKETISDWKGKYEEYHISTLLPFLKNVLVRLLRHVLPIRLKGYLSLGFEDPAVTGYVTAAAAMWYPVYGKSFSFYPDFQEKVFEANCKGRGRIRIIYILYLLVILLLNKDVRAIIFD